MEYIVLALVAAAVLLVAPILGTIAFFRVRRLHQRVEELEAALETQSSGPWGVQQQPVEEVQSAPEPDEQIAGEIPDEEPEQAKVEHPEISDTPEVSAAPAEDEVEQADASKGTLEEAVGARWAVWVGGLALALGGVFLVRYSIEQGLLGPAARISLGALFSLALVALGEWTRRRGQTFSVGGFESANVPAVLTAAGTLAAFATIYAAYQLYGFLGPFAAFLGLGIVAVATMVVALLHGPLLAALGIASSFLVPFVVSSDEPSAIGLAAYAIAVSFAAFGVGRLRFWRWLAIVAALGLVFFGALLFIVAAPGERPVVGIYIVVAWAAQFYVFVASLYTRSADELVPNDRVAATLSGLVLLLALVFTLDQTDAATIAGLVLMVILPFWSAHEWSAARLIVPIAAVAVVLGYSGWDLSVETLQPLTGGVENLQGIDPVVLPGYQQRMLSAYGFLGLALSVLAALFGFVGAFRSVSRVPLAFGGAFVPLAILAVSYGRTDFLDVSVRYGVAALVLSLVFFALALQFERRLTTDHPGRDGTVATCLIATIAAVTLALCMVLERGALTVALALMAPATAIVYRWRPLPALRILALVPAILWAARVAWEPQIVGSLGTTPVFNWLTYGYGVPAAGFVLTAYLLGRQKRDLVLEIAEGIAVATVTAALALIGLHAFAPHQVFTPVDTLNEAALLVFLSGGVALGLLRLKATSESRTLAVAATALGFLGMAAALAGLLGLFNPFLTGERIGANVIFNKLLFAYLLTGLLYGLLGFLSSSTRPIYSRGAFAVGGVLAFAWVTLSIRHWFHPEAIDQGATSDAELYAYSAAWLAIGIATLAVGLVTGVRAVRLVSGVIIVVVVAKVFVVDMSNLTGALRALSFIGLGLVLVAIGLVYQRLLARRSGD